MYIELTFRSGATNVARNTARPPPPVPASASESGTILAFDGVFAPSSDSVTVGTGVGAVVDDQANDVRSSREG